MEFDWVHFKKVLTYHNVFGDTAAPVGVIVERLTGVRAGPLLGDPKDLQNWAFGAQGLSSDFPPKLRRGTGLHSMVRLHPTGNEVMLWPFTVKTMLSGPSGKRQASRTRRRSYSSYRGSYRRCPTHSWWRSWRGGWYGIKRAAAVRSPVVAGDVNDDEGGSSIGGVNSVADRDLRAAVQPEEGEGGAGGDGALQASWTRHFIQGRLVHA